MRKLVVIIFGISATSLAIDAGIFDQLLMFILVGQIPFSGYSIGPTLMLAFWACLIPVLLIVSRFTRHELWLILEALGKLEQRQLKTVSRLDAQSKKFAPLIVATLLYEAGRLPESTSSDPKLYLRRRFVPVPA